MIDIIIVIILLKRFRIRIIKFYCKGDNLIEKGDESF